MSKERTFVLDGDFFALCFSFLSLDIQSKNFLLSFTQLFLSLQSRLRWSAFRRNMYKNPQKDALCLPLVIFLRETFEFIFQLTQKVPRRQQLWKISKIFHLTHYAFNTKHDHMLRFWTICHLKPQNYFYANNITCRLCAVWQMEQKRKLFTERRSRKFM